MPRWTMLLLGSLAAAPLIAQEPPQGLSLDSGTVVRLHWRDHVERARLLAPLEPNSTEVRYCRYPGPVCGGSTLNPPRTRPASELTRLDLRRGSRTGRGALIGAAAGAVGGLIVLVGHGLSDQPAPSKRVQVLTVLSLAGIGSGFGALVGSASDDWARAPR